VKERGSFDSFMKLYLERWLHSYVDHFHGITDVSSLVSLCRDQLITLTTVVPPKLARITGITPDHGLLRTMPERTGWSSGDEGFIDLQPDGNSFDLMAGLIRSKSSR
jgi:biotin--protein ligase